MDQVHVHLLITHLPIIGSILGALVLAYGLRTNSDHTTIASYSILVICSLGAVIAYFTGEGAEESVENIQGVATKMIERHEDSALYTLFGMLAAGLISVVNIYLTITKNSSSRTIAVVTLFISVVSFGFAVRTGYLGGQIRHTEISTSPAANAEGSEDD